MSIGKYVKSYVKKFYFRLSKFPLDINNVNNDNLSNYLKFFDFIEESEKDTFNNALLAFYKNIYNNYKKI